ncbi:MAG: hypothetical protein DI603_19640 [Roseateles depolymerans]|uniref:DUF6265 domain-containing protein n=1 Tax=Roseateles depolymerans TaxID=76731 RepID=A0A2W5FFD0_9BURK|nr:MAG: hypothetical protein DI603_19640 [Roseateles depolymerans]
MRCWRFVSVLLLALSAPGLRAEPADALAPLAWLAGCWAEAGGEPGSQEQWLAPAGGSMLGMNRSLRGGRLAQFEFMLIRTRFDGRLAFVAWPGGRNETEFLQTSLNADEAVFESGRSDFPNRVIYRRTGERSMSGRIEGQANGQPRAVDFPFVRADCR